MKRKLFLIFTIFVILNLFFGCSNPSTPTSREGRAYKIETGVITFDVYRTAYNQTQNWTEQSYSNIASLRDYLYENTLSDYEVKMVSINEIEEFMRAHGSSTSEIESEIRFLKENGNNYRFYTNNKFIWMYVTK